MDLQLYYNIPMGADLKRVWIQYECREVNGYLNYTLFPDSTANNFIIENTQYLHLEFIYRGEPLIIPGSQLYFIYVGQNYFFTGKEINKIPFRSMPLPFGFFYKSQISPFIKDELKNLWPWGKPERDIFFDFNQPYFTESLDNF